MLTDEQASCTSSDAAFALGVASDPRADDPYWRGVYGDLLRSSLCLFSKEVLGLEIGPHMLEWEDMILAPPKQVAGGRRICTLAARDHSKSTFFSYAYPVWNVFRDPGQETYIFSATLDQAMEFLDIIIYGRDNLVGMIDNPMLTHLVPTRDQLMRDPRVRLTKADVRFTNGSRIRALGYGKKTRGRHPRYIVLDDVLNDEDMFSETVRRKNISYYQSAISNMTKPDGQVCVVGTPYHMADLYGWMRKKDGGGKAFRFKAHPGIIKDPDTGRERALFPWRWTLPQLHAKKGEIGSVAFAREILCEPITDDLSVFPSFLFPPLFDSTITLRPTKENLRERGLTTYMGIDIARSANVGADYFVIFVMAKDKAGNRIIVDIRRFHGLPFRRQLEEIGVTAQLYDPAMIYIEANAMQQVYTDEMRRMTDLPVKPFVTTAQNKYPLDKGVPGLRIVMENQKLVIPRGDDYSVRTTDIWMNECQQFGFVDGKLQGIGEHDDCVMAWWFCEEAIRAGGFSFAFGDDEDEGDEELLEGDEDWEDVFLGGREEREVDSAFGI